MLVLSFDPARTGRVNTFFVHTNGPLFRITATVRTTDVATPRHVDFFCQVHERMGMRLRDPEGHHALLLSRSGPGDEFSLEATQLHAALPCMPFVLRGWMPPQ